jgi:hypothetical protein
MLSFPVKRENTAKTGNHIQHINHTIYRCYCYLTTERSGASRTVGQEPELGVHSENAQPVFCRCFGCDQYLAFRPLWCLWSATYPACLRAACPSPSDSLKCPATSAAMNRNGMSANLVNLNTARVIWPSDRVS